MTRPARSAMLMAACGSPGVIMPMKSDSIWKSMSLAWTLYLGVPDSAAGTPRFRARRAARLACHRPYLASRKAAPKSSVVAPSPLSSSTLAKVMSTYRSSCPSEFETRSGFHAGSFSSGRMAPMDRNSVGAPKLTPIIWPAQPPSILSRSSATAISFCAGAAVMESTATNTARASGNEQSSSLRFIEAPPFRTFRTYLAYHLRVLQPSPGPPPLLCATRGSRWLRRGAKA